MRKLIETARPEKPSQRGNPGIPPFGKLEIVLHVDPVKLRIAPQQIFGIDPHRAELVAAEGPSPTTDTPLPEQDRSGALELDRERHENQQGRNGDETHERTHHIDSALAEQLGRPERGLGEYHQRNSARQAEPRGGDRDRRALSEAAGSGSDSGIPNRRERSVRHRATAEHDGVGSGLTDGLGQRLRPAIASAQDLRIEDPCDDSVPSLHQRRLNSGPAEVVPARDQENASHPQSGGQNRTDGPLH